MNITRQKQAADDARFQSWHKLVVAEAGFSMLDVYGRYKHGLDIEVIREFADTVNRRNEAGSLHPKAPISALPRRYFRVLQDTLWLDGEGVHVELAAEEEDTDAVMVESAEAASGALKALDLAV